MTIRQVATNAGPSRDTLIAMHLKSLLRGAHAYLSPAAALAGLSAADAASRPPNVPHSIAEIVAHMAFWQEWFLDRCDSKAAPSPATAALGWPNVDGEAWDAMRERFDAGFKRALTIAEDESRLAEPIAPPIEMKFLATYTVGDALTHVALHNGHHIGQVITLRQLLGAWPPPAGRWTW
jgi:uncharacterized damage-inducible protein DinB